MPRANADWWALKLQTNMARDDESTQALTDQGWTVLRFWEHEDPATVSDRIQAVVQGARRIGRRTSQGLSAVGYAPDSSLLEDSVDE